MCIFMNYNELQHLCSETAEIVLAMIENLAFWSERGSINFCIFLNQAEAE